MIKTPQELEALKAAQDFISSNGTQPEQDDFYRIPTQPTPVLCGIDDLRWLADQGVMFALPFGRTKGKFQKDWQNTPHPIDEAIKHAKAGGNVGILTGKHSGNVIAIDRDVDFPGTCAILGEFGKTVKVIRDNAPDRGKLLFRVIDGEIPPTISWKADPADKHPACEFLGDNGQRHALCSTSVFDGGNYVLLHKEYGIQEITPLELDFIWRVITGGSIDQDVRTKEEEEAYKHAKDDYIKQVFEHWTTKKIFEHFKKDSNGTEKDGKQTRILGNGGLLIGSNNEQWSIPGEKIGGGPLQAWIYCASGKVEKPTGKDFWKWINQMGDAAGIERPKQPESAVKPASKKTPVQAVEDSITFAMLMDEIQALDAASPTGKVDKSALMKYLLSNAERYDNLPALDDAMLRVELQQRKITKDWIDTIWGKVKGEARKAAEAAKPDAPELPQRIKTWPYDVQGGCIGIWKVFKNDMTGEEEEVFSSLCNFDVRIVADVAADDGEETSRKIAIAGTLDTGLPLPEIEIEADEFEFMKWPVAKWGSRVSIEPFKGAASLLRHAIQKLSADTMTDRRTFTHTGWRVIDGKRVFLDADGAIGADGVNVKLPQNLKNYVFPRDNAISAKDAMRASVDLLDIAPARVSAPLYAAIFSAPLSEIITSVFTPSMNGGSGSLKSSFGAVMLNHFGAKFTEYAMPADWLATANSLEKLTFHAKDIPLIIDDFRPSTNPAESRMLQEAVSRITRAVGNRQGRSRLDANSEFKRTYAPRGVVMMTAERNATGKSTTSRILTIDVEPGDISSSLLTVAQKQRHVYPYAMRGYIESIARDYDELAKMLPARVAELRTRNDKGHHKRLPNATAILYAGFECAMSYAVEVEAITPAEAKRRCNDCYQALQSIEQIQSESTEAEDPAIKYVTILASLIAQDKAYLVGKGKNLSNLGMSLSEKLGWYDADNVYLLPGAYNAVCRYATVEGWSFPSDENTLRKELDRQQWLTKHDPNRHTTAARPPGSKSIERVTVIDRAKFAGVLLDMGVEFPPPVSP
jgi:hypothetical protein